VLLTLLLLLPASALKLDLSVAPHIERFMRSLKDESLLSGLQRRASFYFFGQRLTG